MCERCDEADRMILGEAMDAEIDSWAGWEWRTGKPLDLSDKSCSLCTPESPCPWCVERYGWDASVKRAWQTRPGVGSEP